MPDRRSGSSSKWSDQAPDATFLDRLVEVCKVDPPREHGLGTVETIEAMHSGEGNVFVARISRMFTSDAAFSRSRNITRRVVFGRLPAALARGGSSEVLSSRARLADVMSSGRM
jgi:hypothetical protein